jgi:hypothetical protein
MFSLPPKKLASLAGHNRFPDVGNLYDPPTEDRLVLTHNLSLLIGIGNLVVINSLEKVGAR